MQKLTYEQLISVLSEVAENEKTNLESMMGYEEVPEDSMLIGKNKIVHHWGGEGEGDTIGMVYYFEQHDLYIRVQASYDSWEGSHYSEDGTVEQVFPSVSVETVYSENPLTEYQVEKLTNKFNTLVNQHLIK